MAVRSEVVGLETEWSEVEVTPRLAMAYAAGVGDRNPLYLDDARPEPVLAPPAFCTSLEWAALAPLRKLPALGMSPDEARRGVHASQDSEFHRPIRAGARLRTRARIVELRAIPPGVLMLTRIETVDAASGEPVVTTWSGSIYRDVPLEGGAECLEAIPPLPTSRPGSQVRSGRGRIGLEVAPEAAHVYTECARIWNPIHTERRVAHAAGLPDIILHGTATWAIAARELVNRCAAGDPTRLRRLAGRFAAMIVPGTRIALDYTRAGERVDFEVLNDKGEPAIARGVALLELA